MYNDRNQKSAGLPKEQRGIMTTATINIQMHLLMSTWVIMIIITLIMIIIITLIIIMMIIAFRYIPTMTK